MKRESTVWWERPLWWERLPWWERPLVAIFAKSVLALVLAGILPVAISAPREVGNGFIGKPIGPIAIQYEILGEPALGRMLEIAVTVVSSMPLGDVTVSYGAAEGLTVNSPREVRIPNIVAGGSYRTALTVTPLVIDVLDLTITVEADVGGMRQAQTALLAVRLAGEKSRPPVNLKPDASGGVVHAFRGVETTARRLR